MQLLALDLYTAADPALDVGNCLAHVTEWSLRSLGEPGALAACGRAMTDRFRELTFPRSSSSSKPSAVSKSAAEPSNNAIERHCRSGSSTNRVSSRNSESRRAFQSATRFSSTGSAFAAEHAGGKRRYWSVLNPGAVDPPPVRVEESVRIAGHRGSGKLHHAQRQRQPTGEQCDVERRLDVQQPIHVETNVHVQAVVDPPVPC